MENLMGNLVIFTALPVFICMITIASLLLVSKVMD